VIVSIIVAALVSGIVAFIVSNITEDINTIVTSCLASVWAAEIVILFLRNRIIYNKKMKMIDINDVEKLNKEKHKLKKAHILSTVIFSIFFGYILYNIRGQVINSINGTGEDITTKATNSPTIYLKIGITIVLVIILTIRIIQKNKDKGNIK
jgi:ABC-type uncharacterized transport system permease subunit